MKTALALFIAMAMLSPGGSSSAAAVGSQVEDYPSETITPENGFSASASEVRFLLRGWDLTEAEAIAIANFQLTTGSLAADVLAANREVAGVELLIGGRDEGVESDEILLEVGIAGVMGVSLENQLRRFDQLAFDALAVAERTAGRTRYQERSASNSELVAKGELAFAHVRLISVELTNSELADLAESIASDLPSEPVTLVDADWRAGVELIPTGMSYEEYRAAAEATDASGCHTSQSSAEQHGDMKGGRLILTDLNTDSTCAPSRICTTAMPTTIGTTRGFFTAGHCFNDSWAANTAGVLTNGWANYDTVVRYIADESDDYAWASPYWRHHNALTRDMGVAQRRWTTTTANGQIWKYDQALWRNITAYENEWRAQGYDVCQPAHGEVENPPKRTTYCAEVTDSIVNRDGYDVGSQYFTEMDWAASTTTTDPSMDDGPGGGASGGPMFYGSTTYGIFTGSSFVHSDEGIYMRWGPIHDIYQSDLGATADFVCYSASGSWGVVCDPT